MTSSIGPLTIEVRGESELSELVANELTPVRKGGGSPDVVFEIGRSTRGRAGRSEAITRMKGSRTPFRFGAESSGDTLQLTLGLKGLSEFYRVEIVGDLLGEGKVEVRIEVPSLKGWSVGLDPFVKLLGRDRATMAEITAKNIIYELVDPLLWTRLLAKGATFLHASSVAFDGKAIIFAGSGGVGKSSSLLSLMESNDRFRYLGDDLVILDRNGALWRHPKHLQIYEHNLQRSPGTRRAINRKLSTAERVLWRARTWLLGSHRVRKRMSAADLFGVERVADSATLAAVAWITPATHGEGWAQVQKSLVVDRGAAAIFDEFWDFLRLVNLGSQISPLAPSVAVLAEKAERTLNAGLADTPCFQLDFPVTNSEELAGSLLESLIDSVGS